MAITDATRRIAADTPQGGAPFEPECRQFGALADMPAGADFAAMLARARPGQSGAGS